MANSADPDQLASEEANWSGSTLFAKTEHVVLSKGRVNPDPAEPDYALTLQTVYPDHLASSEANWSGFTLLGI